MEPVVAKLLSRFSLGLLVAVLCLATARPAAERPADPLPSWNDGPTKAGILRFVTRVTAKGGPDYVPPAERIATFDNDGTLWCEQPMYVQVVFAAHRARELAPIHPDWKTKQPFKTFLDGDRAQLGRMGEQDYLDVVVNAHAGMTTDEYARVVTDWLATARHPRFKRPYTELIYQPMRELLTYLRANEFKTFIVSGGGVEFMRNFTDRIYGVPPEEIVGSSIKTEFQLRDGKPTLVLLPKATFIDNEGGKPVGIHEHIGRRPIAAFGNSDGDLQMLQYTAAGAGARFMLLVHHDDAEREYAYDRPSVVGQLDNAWDEARERGWTVVSMKRDWKVIFPPAAK